MGGLSRVYIQKAWNPVMVSVASVVMLLSAWEAVRELGGRGTVRSIALATMGGLYLHAPVVRVLTWTTVMGVSLVLVAPVLCQDELGYAAFVLPRAPSRFHVWMARVMALAVVVGVYTIWLGAIVVVVSMLSVPIFQSVPLRGMASIGAMLGFFALGLFSLSLGAAVVARIIPGSWVLVGGLTVGLAGAVGFDQGLVSWVVSPFAYTSFRTAVDGSTYQLPGMLAINGCLATLGVLGGWRLSVRDTTADVVD